MKYIRILTLILLLLTTQYSHAQIIGHELTTIDDGAGDIGLYNDNQRGAFTNQDGSGGIDIRNLGPDELTDDSEATRKRAGLLQFNLGDIDARQITNIEMEFYMLQGSTTADVEIYGVLDEHDSLGLAGDGSPGFDPADPDFHFANSGLFHYYDHEDALFPLNDPSIIDDDDVVNGGFYDSTLDLMEEKVELLLTQSEEGDGEPDMIFSLFDEETPEILDFVKQDTNGKVLFLLMPTSAAAVTLSNNAPSGIMYLRVDESIVAGTLGDFNNNDQLDIDDLNSLVAAIGGNDASFDVNDDNTVDADDLTKWVKDLKFTWFGDANLDGEFNSADFVDVFIAGKFETNEPAVWNEGDWNGDGAFTTADFVTAFIDGGFELGPRTIEVTQVPEPSSLVLLMIGALCFLRRRIE